MKQIEKEIAEINRMRTAIKNTSSRYLIRDYNKAIAQKIKDLKDRPLLLFVNEWSVGMVLDRNKGLKLSEFAQN